LGYHFKYNKDNRLVEIKHVSSNAVVKLAYDKHGRLSNIQRKEEGYVSFLYGYRHKPTLPSHVHGPFGWKTLYYDWRGALLAVKVGNYDPLCT
jgi:YD repeat-containing protein